MQCFKDRSNSRKRTLFEPTSKSIIVTDLMKYEQTASKYKSYVNELNQRVEKVCQKENFRTYLTQQNIHKIKERLETQKTELQAKLSQKRDLTKSANGKLHAQLLSLSKLEREYDRIRLELEKKLQNQQQNISIKKANIHELDQAIKSTLKQNLVNEDKSNSQITKLPNIKASLSESGLSDRKSVMSCQSKTKQSMLQKLNLSYSQKMKERVEKEEQKLTLLKLFTFYARKTQEEGIGVTKMAVIVKVQKQIEQKIEIISELKSLMNSEL